MKKLSLKLKFRIKIGEKRFIENLGESVERLEMFFSRHRDKQKVAISWAFPFHGNSRKI